MDQVDVLLDTELPIGSIATSLKGTGEPLALLVKCIEMFFQAALFNGNITSWDTSQVTDMTNMFTSAQSFNQDISDWDTLKVKGMDYMFAFQDLPAHDFSYWDVSNVVSEGNIVSDIVLTR